MIVLGPAQADLSDDLGQALRAVVPPLAIAAYVHPSEEPSPLFPEEEAAIIRAVPSRRREFALGRWCARTALGTLGVKSGPIPMAANRGPRWPAGFVGSITHCQGFVAAVAASADRMAAFGLDVEQALPLGDDLLRLVCRPEELGWIETAPPPTVGNWAKVLFSAKEAIHKCIAPLSGLMLDFRDVAVSLETDARTFRATLVEGDRARLPDFSRIEGRFALTREYVLTSAMIAAPRQPPR